MSESVQIVLIIATVVVFLLFIFRRQLSDFQFKGGKDGVDMHLKTRRDVHKPTEEEPRENSSGIIVRKNRLWGRKNEIDVQKEKTKVEENELLGDGQKIKVRPEQKK